MRELKYHERKLLKKVDLLNYKREGNLREIKVLRRYHVSKREDYTKYNRLVGQVTKLSKKLRTLDSADPFRIKMTEQLLAKLFAMGVIPTKKSLMVAEKVTVSAFCRRRIPVVMVRMKMSETVKEATELVEQGHVRVGPEVITDPAFMVTRAMEDHLTWVDTSKIKRHVAKYNDKVDDFDLLGC